VEILPPGPDLLSAAKDAVVSLHWRRDERDKGILSEECQGSIHIPGILRVVPVIYD
jgi:hypothetical protein